MRVLLVVLLVPTVLALTTDYLKITMIFFKGNHFSVFKAISAIFHMKQYGFALLLVVYLVVMPIAWITCLFILQMQKKENSTLKMVTTILGNWAMLDVFGLALFLFMLEGSRLI